MKIMQWNELDLFNDSAPYYSCFTQDAVRMIFLRKHVCRDISNHKYLSVISPITFIARCNIHLAVHCLKCTFSISVNKLCCSSGIGHRFKIILTFSRWSIRYREIIREAEIYTHFWFESEWGADLLASPWHQQHWRWLYKVNGLSYSTRKNYLLCLTVDKWHNIQIHIYVS